MSRKSAAAIVSTTVVTEVPAPAAPRRARRAKLAAPAPAPAPVAVEVVIDLTQPNAKDALTKAFPKNVTERMIPASPEMTAAALEYMNARDAEAIAAGRKERVANELRYAIKSDQGIAGDGWKATWKAEKGDIDVGALLKHLNVPSEVIEQFRRADKRVLRVTETATEKA